MYQTEFKISETKYEFVEKNPTVEESFKVDFEVGMEYKQIKGKKNILSFIREADTTQRF